MNSQPTPPEFDAYAARYDQSLDQGLAVSGEDKYYFARGRIAWLGSLLQMRSVQAHRVLDFGCGTGASIPLLRNLLGASFVVGVDTSTQSLEAARRQHGTANTHLLTLGNYHPAADMDVAYCNGVFHHIPLIERAGAIDLVFRSLRPGGLFAFWENNPWNPGTRYVMRRILFDRNAIPLPPPEARALVAAGGFEVLQVSYLFIFPKALKALRWLEAPLSRWPLGAQYQVLCRKPLR